MDHNKKYEHARFIIDRFDHYYDAANNKGAFYIGLNTFIFGGICVGYSSLHKEIEPTFFIWVLLGVLLFCCLSSIAFTMYAISPFLKNNQSNNPRPSLLFFGGIARYEFSYFKTKFEELTDESTLDDLLQQGHCLARGLTEKYKLLKSAGVLILIQFLIILPLLFLTVKNFKQ